MGGWGGGGGGGGVGGKETLAVHSCMLNEESRREDSACFHLTVRALTHRTHRPSLVLNPDSPSVESIRAQELCENRGGRPTVSVDVKAALREVSVNNLAGTDMHPSQSLASAVLIVRVCIWPTVPSQKPVTAVRLHANLLSF